MKRFMTIQLSILWGATVLLLFASTCIAEQQREIIGTVLGKPVYRDQITATEGEQLHSQLHKYFTRPVLKKYYLAHQSEIDPTQKEIEQFVTFFQKKHAAEMKDKRPTIEANIRKIKEQLNDKKLAAEQRKVLEDRLGSLEYDLAGPDKGFAMFVLPNWKMQIHFYKNFGRGRVLWQQTGIEAFDAMHRWLRHHEKKGEFTILDPKLRDAFYYYWTTLDHGALLIDDPKKIEQQFLHPEWLKTGAQRLSKK